MEHFKHRGSAVQCASDTADGKMGANHWADELTTCRVVELNSRVLTLTHPPSDPRTLTLPSSHKKVDQIGNMIQWTIK
jgi:hypothetical protein